MTRDAVDDRDWVRDAGLLGHVVRIERRWPSRQAIRVLGLNFQPFGKLQRVIQLDSEITDRALQLGVAQEQRAGPEVACLAIEDGDLRSPQAMAAVCRGFETDQRHPLLYEPN